MRMRHIVLGVALAAPAPAAMAVSTSPLEVPVNSTTLGEQALPRVAADADGDFVVVWRTWNEPDNPNYRVKGRRYDREGNPRGDEFALATQANANDLGNPAVAMDRAGNFAVAWVNTDFNASPQPGDISVRCFNADGSPKGAEIYAASAPAVTFDELGIAMDAQGRFCRCLGYRPRRRL